MKKRTVHEFTQRFGKMVKGLHSLLLDEDQLSDTQNMEPGYSWKQRKGMATLTATPVASGLRFKTMVQYRDIKGNTDAIIAHTYDGSGGEDVYMGSALPPNAITWTKKYDLTANCENCQFATVNGALLLANNKEFLIWRGNSHFPSGVWKYINSATSYIDYYDFMVDGDATTVMPLDSLTTSDFVYVMSEMPLDKITLALSAYNGNFAVLTVKKWNGAWTALTVTDGTAASYTLDDTFPGSTLNAKWTETDPNSELSINDGLDWAPTNDSSVSKVTSNFRLSGNFDIYIQFSNLSWSVPSANNNYFYLRAYNSANDQAYVTQQWGTGGSRTYGADVKTDGSWTGLITTATTDNSGYLRMARTGTDDFEMWFGAPGSWTSIGTFASEFTESVQVIIEANSGDGSEWTSLTVDQVVDNGSATYEQTSLTQDGDITWTAASDEEMRLIEGQPGYAYQLSWDGALDGEVEITGMSVHSPMAAVKDIWDGQPRPPSGCYVYDGTDHTDAWAYVNNTVQAQYADLSGATTSYKFYVGFSERVTTIMVHPAADGKNTGNVSITAIKYHNASGTWTTVGSVTDTSETGNATLSQKGEWSWVDPGSANEYPTKVGGDLIAMYWYEVTFDATLSDPTYVYYIQGVPAQETLDYSYGVMAYKTRAWQIAPLNDETAFRYSSGNLPNTWNGADSGYIYFGERPMKAAAAFYNEAVCFADSEIWMLQGNSPTNFGKLRLSDEVGIAAPSSLVSIESGTVVGDSIKVVLAWFFYDGIWLFDGVRIWKVSSPDVETFFDPDHTDYINPAKIGETQGVYDHETQCVVWTVYSGSGTATTPTKCIVMHFPTLHFGVYDYGDDIGALCAVLNNRYYLVAGGHASGRFFQLNSGTTDRDSSNSEVAVDAYIITRDMFLNYSDGLRERLMSIWTESQEAGGYVEVDEYPDGSDTPQNVSKKSMTMVGKIFGALQRTLKFWPGQKTVKFRIRNRSKNARMNLLGMSTTVDKGRAEE
jgi:hypothetical protein